VILQHIAEKTLLADRSKRSQRRGAHFEPFERLERFELLLCREVIDGSTGLTMSGVAHI
jgi:hypothetical protein